MADGDAVLAAIHGRRSVGRVGPEPLGRAAVEELLEAAVAAPNHRLTAPWRFIVLAGAARDEVGAAHARAVARLRPDADEEALATEAGRLRRAPVVIVAAVSPGEDPVQAREDRDAVAAAVQNLLLAAHARGLAAMWRTGAMADEPEVREALGLTGREAIVAFVYLGRRRGPGAGRGPARRPAADVTTWRGW
jgi:nitroreductase